jgi:hypothetical protein
VTGADHASLATDQQHAQHTIDAIVAIVDMARRH